ncbi:helix-turn-helix transcriptional regulator [Mesorhizobium sp. SP-1A]|uniref:helix-turn-helix domain-containing protein n=1 Tax=Mesorhizobium sp. SP-1A TaxID=3077840 RepID=UPI0028F735E9|nr:helix-turn-helix transcriptional regulator [Mesorhizobium sp. SP-1A]
MSDDLIDIAALRERLGWTQQQLADFCGTDRSTVSKWEKDPPSKGPARVLLRQLQQRVTDNRAGEAA